MVCGAASTPQSPPVTATAFSSSSVFELAFVEERASPRMRQEDRPFGPLAGLHRGEVARVRHVDRHPEAVHPSDGVASEGRESAVARIADPAAELVRLAVGDPAHPDPEPVQHVQSVELVLDRRRALEAWDQRDPARSMSFLDVGDG